MLQERVKTEKGLQKDVEGRVEGGEDFSCQEGTHRKPDQGGSTGAKAWGRWRGELDHQKKSVPKRRTSWVLAPRWAWGMNDKEPTEAGVGWERSERWQEPTAEGLLGCCLLTWDATWEFPTVMYWSDCTSEGHLGLSPSTLPALASHQGYISLMAHLLSLILFPALAP